MPGDVVPHSRPPRSEPRQRQTDTLTAWRHFIAGDDVPAIDIVPTPILLSWRRCRDLHGLDPVHPLQIRRWAAARARTARYSGIYAKLGGTAAAIVDGVQGCLATVTDGDGRILASWAASALRRRAADCKLEPDFGWSESAGGTNGMGTALVQRQPVVIRGPEHWHQDMHEWTCLGVAVHDPVSAEPIAALNVSSLMEGCLAGLADQLCAELDVVEQALEQRAHRDGLLVAEQFCARSGRQRRKLIGIDWAGNVVAASEDFEQALNLGGHGVLLDPRERRLRTWAALRELARTSLAESGADPSWQGSAALGPPFSLTPELYSVSPVTNQGLVLGWIVASLEETCGQSVTPSGSGAALPTRHKGRIVAVTDSSDLLLDPEEIRYAEADRHSVWLVTDYGRFRAATRGMDNLESELTDHGFVRVHRGFLVNSGRVRRIYHKGNGLIALSTDARRAENIPVSRRSTPAVRRILGI